jgi:predicted Zn finger-like uncharacterized protein
MNNINEMKDFVCPKCKTQQSIVDHQGETVKCIECKTEFEKSKLLNKSPKT